MKRSRRPRCVRLMTVPGVSVITASTFVAAIGDIRRFPSARRLVGYLGLDPRVRQSGAGRHGTGGSPSRARAGPARARRSGLDRGPHTGPAARVLRARPRAPRRTGRRGRHRAQARDALLVPAHPRAGLRLRPAVADAQEDPPPRAHRRRAVAQGPGPRRSRRRATSRSARPSARSRYRPRTPTGARRRLEATARGESGRERDTGARISKALEGQSRAADHKPLTSALRFRQSLAPTNRLPQEPPPNQPLTFIRQSCGRLV